MLDALLKYDKLYPGGPQILGLNPCPYIVYLACTGLEPAPYSLSHVFHSHDSPCFVTSLTFDCCVWSLTVLTLQTPVVLHVVFVLPSLHGPPVSCTWFCPVVFLIPVVTHLILVFSCRYSRVCAMPCICCCLHPCMQTFAVLHLFLLGSCPCSFARVMSYTRSCPSYRSDLREGKIENRRTDRKEMFSLFQNIL